MKVSIHQHIPAFCEGLEPETGAVDDADGLGAIPFIASWTKQDGFKRFSQDGAGHLMAEMADGAYWVVGFTSGEIPGLPKWKP